MEYSLAILKLIYLTIGRLEYECPQMVLLKYQLKKTAPTVYFLTSAYYFLNFLYKFPQT